LIATYILDCSSLPEPEQEWLDGLPRGRREKTLSLKQRASRQLSFGAGLLLKEVLPQECTDVSYGAYGKPYYGHCAVSISHSGRYAVASAYLSGAAGHTAAGDSAAGQTVAGDTVAAGSAPGHTAADDTALSGGVSLGCDIEVIRDYNDKVARRFFMETEYALLCAQPDSGRRAALFYRLWTRKESVLKLTGLGMALPLGLFDVSGGTVCCAPGLDGWVKEQVRRLDGSGEYEKKRAVEAAWDSLNETLYFQDYEYGGCHISVCANRRDFAPQICEKKLALEANLC